MKPDIRITGTFYPSSCHSSPAMSAGLLFHEANLLRCCWGSGVVQQHRKRDTGHQTDFSCLSNMWTALLCCVLCFQGYPLL